MTDPKLAQLFSLARPALDSLQRVNSTVAVASGLAASGRRIDLQGLDMAAGLLCAQVLDLPPIEAAELVPALCDLQSRLASLGQALAAQALAGQTT